MLRTKIVKTQNMSLCVFNDPDPEVDFKSEIPSEIREKEKIITERICGVCLLKLQDNTTKALKVNCCFSHV